jgi:hypothetical protein
MTKFDFYWRFVERPLRIIGGFFQYEVFKRDNAFLINRWVKRHRNEVMVHCLDLVRLIGWTNQYKEDYYYVLDYVVRGKGHQILLMSCVGEPTRLKRRMKRFDYYSIEEDWNRNGGTVEECLERAKKKKIIVK